MNSRSQQKSQEPPQTTELAYPKRELRYSRVGWNTNNQDCYTESDISLLRQIQDIYLKIIGDKRGESYFSLTEIKEWRDWWTCDKPSSTNTESTTIHDSFTLPNREAKNSHTHPLANFAEHMARKIANWQSDRVQNQQTELMNDPVMLIFAELRDWFFLELAEKECNLDVLDDLAKRQSYIKSLIHLIPHFGPDRKYLHDIQKSLDIATYTVKACVANKALPQLLSDLIISGKSMEATLGSYLHFLLIDEPVADNFSPDSLEVKDANCMKSPICTIYHRSELPSGTAKTTDSLTTTKSSRFYNIEKVSERIDEHGSSLQAKLSLRTELVDTIKFASFVTSQDKSKYLEALAAVDLLIDVRQLLEKFNHIQTSLGTYAFAVSYLEQADRLANYYIKIIQKTNSHINQLLTIAEDGHGAILSRGAADKRDKLFEKNLKALETRFAKGTTVRAQLSKYCEKTIESMQKYQDEIKKLAANVQSGEASDELQAAMRDLYNQMHYLNSMLPAVLDEPYMTVTNPDRMLTAVPARLEDDRLSIEAIDEEIGEECLVTAKQPPVEKMNIQINEMIAWDVDTHNSTGVPIITLQINDQNASTNTIEFHGKIHETHLDAQSGLPIFVFLYGDNQNELGTIEFYGAPYFCVSKDKTQHNIIKTTGVFSSFTLDKKRLAEEREICQFHIPNFTSRLVSSIGSGALHGFLRGGSNIISERLTKSPGFKRNLVSKFTYMGCIFTVNFTNQIMRQGFDNVNPFDSFLNALAIALSETSSIAIFSFGMLSLTELLDYTASVLVRNKKLIAGKIVHGTSTLTKYGLFAYSALVGGDYSTAENASKTIGIAAGSVIAGAVTENLTEGLFAKVIKMADQSPATTAETPEQATDRETTITSTRMHS